MLYSTPPPEIAVLMPVFNPGPELVVTLKSIRDQSVPCRLYLVDDGSRPKPDYVSLLDGMDHKLIVLPENQGISRALNAGLATILAGNYSFVARMDNGDINVPERFATQKAYLENRPDLAFVGSHVRFEYEVTGLKIDVKNPEDPDRCAEALRYNAPFTHPAIMFRMDFLRDFKAYSEDYPAAEDYAMEFWAHDRGYRFGNVPQLLYRTVEMRESISGGSRRKQLKSRLRLQVAHADWLNVHTYLGIGRTLCLMCAPISLLRKAKAAVK